MVFNQEPDSHDEDDNSDSSHNCISSHLAGHISPKILVISKMRSVFLCANEMAKDCRLLDSLRMGLVARATKQVIRGLEYLAPHPDSEERREAEVSQANDLIIPAQ